MRRIAEEDLEHILQYTLSIWEIAREKTIFITGGTGFFGKWLLESFLYVNEKLNLCSKLVVLSRNPPAFLRDNPQFNHSSISFITGDIATFLYPDIPIDYIVHAATEASAILNVEFPFLMFDAIVSGTRHILELAKLKEVSSILHTSSGAVYGKQPGSITHMYEDYLGAPDIYEETSAYGEGKRVAEMLANLYHLKYAVPSKIARCYAFIGPYLPLNQHYAIGNFLNDVLNEKDILVAGNGTPYRSYLYASDLVVWLWTILFKGISGRPYNVGSDNALTIEELAGKIAGLSQKKLKVQVMGKIDAHPPLRYVPSIDRVKKELGLEVKIDLESALQKTLKFYL